MCVVPCLLLSVLLCVEYCLSIVACCRLIVGRMLVLLLGVRCVLFVACKCAILFNVCYLLLVV